MKRTRAIGVSALLALGAAQNAHADWAVGAGGEYFRWRESISPAVKETGMRLALGLTWTQSKDAGWSAGYDFKWYRGNVDYDGATFFGGVPITGTTRYSGMANEARIFYRFANRPMAIMGALGWDHWNRRLTLNQREVFDVFYARLGGDFSTAVKEGILGSAGIKYPFHVRENAHLTDIGFPMNPRLEPRGALSLYGTVGYRFNAAWDVVAYYDSFRFKQSDFVDAGGGFFVFQPKSSMDVFGVKAMYNF